MRPRCAKTLALAMTVALPACENTFDVSDAVSGAPPRSGSSGEPEPSGTGSSSDRGPIPICAQVGRTVELGPEPCLLLGTANESTFLDDGTDTGCGSLFCNGSMRWFEFEHEFDVRLDIETKQLEDDVRLVVFQGPYAAGVELSGNSCLEPSIGVTHSFFTVPAGTTVIAVADDGLFSSCGREAQFSLEVRALSYAGASPTEDSGPACQDELDNDDDGNVDCDDFECEALGLCP